MMTISTAACTLLFFLGHLALADHRSNPGGLKTTNAENLIFATEECILRMHCGPILRTTKRYCMLSKQMKAGCVRDRQGDGSCTEIINQLKSTTIAERNFCNGNHQKTPSKQKYRTCSKVNKFIHGNKCDVSPSISSNRVNVERFDRNRREHGAGRRLQFDQRNSLHQMPNSIRSAPLLPLEEADNSVEDQTEEEEQEASKQSDDSMEAMVKMVAQIIADNDDGGGDGGHVQAMEEHLNKNHPSRTSTTPTMRTTTRYDNSHHLPEGTFLFVGIFSAMLLMIVIFALVLCRSRHPDNVISELYAGKGNPVPVQQQQQITTTITKPSTRRKQQKQQIDNHRVAVVINKKSDYDAFQETLK